MKSTAWIVLFRFQIQNYTYLVWCTHRRHDLPIAEMVFRGKKWKEKFNFSSERRR